MYTKIKSDKKGALAVVFLVFGICISLATGIITAYMSDNGCSPAFIAVAVFSFLYLVINLVLIISAKAWERTPTWIVFVLLLGIFIVTLIGLGYAAQQSLCQINICGRDFQKYNDDFWGTQTIKDARDNLNCDNIDNDALAKTVVVSMGYYERVNPGSSFYIRRGWPISFTVLQFITCLIQLVLTFLNLYSCSGCKPSPVSKGVSY